MHFLKFRFSIVLLALFCAEFALGQSFDQGGSQWSSPEQLGQPKFHVQLIKRLIEDTTLSRMDIVVEVVNDFLQFVRSDSGTFEATIDISLSLSAKGGGEVQRQIITIKKQTKSYDETNSRRELLTGLFFIEQPPGDYKISILMVDKESNRRERAEKDISLGGYPGNGLELSDLMIIRTNEIVPGTRTPRHPNSSEVVGEGIEDVYLYFDLKRPAMIDPCQAVMSIYDTDDIIIHSDSMSVIGGSELAAYSMKLPVKGLKFGRYRVDLTCTQGSNKALKTKHFDVNSFGLPKTIRDLELSIKQMKYVASDDEIESLQKEFASQREQKFIDFWNEKFPVEAEKINGKMIEYYSRISYANENFSGTLAGWETDRGRILVLYGKPTEVERNVFEQDGTPYEVWYYSHLGKRFTFRDDYGFGDFRLVTPAW